MIGVLMWFGMATAGAQTEVPEPSNVASPILNT
jgi:hypothetical protein